MWSTRRAVTNQIPRIASRTISTQIPKVGAGARAAITWAFPVLVGVTWIIWPALDSEWLLEKGLGPDPEADITMVHNARMVRMEAYAKEHGSSQSETKDDGDDEEDEEEETVQEDADEEEEEAGGDEEEQKGEENDNEESGDSEEEDDEEEEEEEEVIKLKPLFVPTNEWESFAVKSLKFGDDDDDDDEDEDDGT